MPDATRPQPRYRTSGVGAPRVGLFIDCENQSHTRLTEMIATASTEEGRLVVRRAYADWIDEAGGDWHAACIANAVHQVQAQAFSRNKNAADMAMAVDVMELFFTNRIDVACIASGDSDFTPLVRKLREYGVRVVGIGAGASVSNAFRNACDRYVDIPASTGPSTVAERSSRTALASSDESRVLEAADLPPWEELVRIALANSRSNDGWTHLGWAGGYIRKLRPDFDPARYGFSGLRQMVASRPDLFEIEDRVYSPGTAPDPHMRPTQHPTLDHATAPSAPE